MFSQGFKPLTRSVSALLLVSAFAFPSISLAVNPFDGALQTYGATKSAQILNSTRSSGDGNPNPFNPVLTNVNNGVHSGEFFAFTPANVDGWKIKVTKPYRGLSDLAGSSGFGWVNSVDGSFYQMMPNGAATGTVKDWIPGDVTIYPVCTTGTRRYSYQSNPGFLPMMITGKESLTAIAGKFRVYCEDLGGPDGDYDYNDHGYIVEVAATQCNDGIDNDGDGFTDLADIGCPNKRGDNEDSKRAQCQDKVDNDGDGKIDMTDPGCSNSQDDDESDGPSPITVIGECVQDNKDGTFTAYFGYNNSGGVTTVVEGMDTKNSFAPAPADRGQPTTFQPGRQAGVFSLTFDGSVATWTVRVKGNGASSASVTKSSTACQSVTPVAECLDTRPTGVSAVFGYVNKNSFPIKLPIGVLNHFAPVPENRGQLTTFAAGTVSGAVKVAFADGTSWTLTGGTSVAQKTLAACPGSCAETSVVDVKGNLDAAALQLAAIAASAADELAKARKKLEPKSFQSIQIDAKRAKARADKYLKQVRELLLQYPAVVQNCPSPIPQCVTIDRQATIEGLRGLYAQLFNLVKRTAGRGDFKKTGMTSRINKLVVSAKSVRDSGLTGLNALPRNATECSK